MNKAVKTKELFECEVSYLKSLFESCEYPWEMLPLLKDYIKKLIENGISKVETGVFAADMKVEIENDGPVTIVMDTDIWCKK